MAGRKRTVTIDEFLGNVLEDVLKGSGKPASRFAAKHGRDPETGFGLRLGMRGALDATLVEDAKSSRGFSLRLTPGIAIPELGSDSGLGFDQGRDTAIDGKGSGKIEWWCEVAIGDTQGMAWIQEIEEDGTTEAE